MNSYCKTQIPEVCSLSLKFRYVSRLVIVVAVMFHLGCTTQSVAVVAAVDSTKAVKYQEEPPKVFVGVRNHEFSEDFDNGFFNSFAVASAQCGVETEIYFVSELDLENDASDFSRAGRNSNADAYLQVLPNGGTKNGGQIVLLEYEANLWHTPIDGEHQKVWLASVEIRPGTGSAMWSSVGVALGQALSGKLWTDGVFKDCLEP